jgi:SAM-dependent methyltransferase
MLSNMTEIPLHEMWDISGKALHTPEYRSKHSAILANAVESTDSRILDTACGAGFPSLDLYRAGYRHILAADADENLLSRFRTLIGRKHLVMETMQTTWQHIHQSVNRQFDVVLNVDASIGFMDTWMGGTMSQGQDLIFARIEGVLRNFRQCVRPGGCLIVGLQKNNHKGNKYCQMDIGASSVDGLSFFTRWEMHYDWSARIKVWKNIIRTGDKVLEQVTRSYLFDKFELTELMYAVGFESVRELATPVELYEDLLLARNPRSI